MREFFKGWRRRVGIVTLVLACVLTVIWYRSYVVADDIGYAFQDEYEVTSSQTGITSYSTDLSFSIWSIALNAESPGRSSCDRAS